MPEEIDTPLTEEELALARKGEALIRASVADVEAPQSLREAIENDRTRGAAREPRPFWRRRRGLVACTVHRLRAGVLSPAVGVCRWLRPRRRAGGRRGR